MKSNESSTYRLKEGLAHIPNYRVSAPHLPYESGRLARFRSPSSTNQAKLIDRESERWELMLILLNIHDVHIFGLWEWVDR